MPYASKGQLYSLLRRQVRFDQRTAAQYMREVLEAVRYIHSFSPKIIHRDIKPENLLLDENYRVLLSDFGWSNFLDENESRKTFCGTPEYLSPEMAKKNGHNEMVDIWALGVLLFEFLAGYAPFSGSCPKELYTNIKKLKVNWPVDFPPLAKNLVSKILKLNPSERLSVEEILDHSWFTQNPPLRHVLTNYLTDEKDILKSHLIIATPESVEDKINDITDPHKKRKFGTLKIKYNDDDSNDINSNSDKNIISIKENVDEENEENSIKENKQDNNDIITRMYMSNIHENYIFLKKEKKELQKKYDELVIKEKKENDLIKVLDEENKKLKNKKENLKNSHIMIINEEIKKYKLLSEDREKILNELDEVNNKNSELYLQNELLQNEITLMKKEQEELNNKIINLTKENNDYLSKIEELTKKLEELGNNNNSSGITLNFEDQNKLASQLNEMTEQNMKKLNEYISPINLNFENLEKKVEALINDKVLSLVDNKIKAFDDLLNEKNDKNNNDIHFEENKKLIEELKESKNKITVSNNNDNKFDHLKNKNNILEERIKNLMEEKKVSDELNESKNKELEKAKTTIKNLNDKIYDINSYINSNCKNESFKKKLCSICQLDDFK